MNTKVIAVAGKGGTGKSSFSSLVTTILVRRNLKPVLVVDADPNYCMDSLLGVGVERTLGDVRDEAIENKDNLSTGMDKRSFVELKINQCLVEAKDFDLLCMGKTEGPDCYCFVNNLLRGFMDQITGNYKYVVMDNEAGMEHLSRRTSRNADFMFVVCEPTLQSLRAGKRIRELTRTLDLNIGTIALVINKVKGDITQLKDEINDTGIEKVFTVPYDEDIVGFELNRKPFTGLPDDSPALKQVESILGELNVIPLFPPLKKGD